MNFYDKPIDYAVKIFKSDINNGLRENIVKDNRGLYGVNILSKKKKSSVFSKIISTLFEPMMLILSFSFLLTLGINLGKYFKTGESDLTECFGILAAIILSVSITLIMERSSEKAFDSLNKLYDKTMVKVVRDRKVNYVFKDQVVAGDIILLSSGDKIVADGRLIESSNLTVDESTLTGESLSSKKDATKTLNTNTLLAERVNSVFSGTFITSGTGKMIVTAVGDKTEIGSIAEELKKEKEVPSPLTQKLNKLSKIITIIGVFFAVLVFGVSIFKATLNNELTFSTVQNLFISSVVLVVAAVPEGLPTIVAVSLALNMIKLAKENALIKKMSATETAGAVSVICSDKTGTLTENKMTLLSFCGNEYCINGDKIDKDVIWQNFICNSTADVQKKANEYLNYGSGTECALITAYIKSNKKESYQEYRKKYKVIDRENFSSEKKFMSTTILLGETNRKLIKGAPEKILPLCNLTDNQRIKLISSMAEKQKEAKRILCFAHDDGNGYIYDGYAVLRDGIREGVKDAVKTCKTAGIKVKILTGDNYITAFAIAKELGVVKGENEVVNGSDIEKVSDQELIKILSKVSVIARSTPLIKLRVVKALKSIGEVVATTGDGINDAPAIKHADVGVAMGKIGSDISKEAADIVLIDDSFATIVKAISFGRNVYKNLQRFIIFQLSVNVSALLFITICALFGVDTPFNTLQLLWINVIMDGPPAITLGLNSADKNLMNNQPVKRDKSIVSVNMLLKIIFNGVFVTAIMCAQYFYNFLGVKESEKLSTIFTLFILFQLFNAFNSTELGANSILKSLGKNKLMAITFTITFVMQIFIVQVGYKAFNIMPLTAYAWIKIILTALSIIVVSEIFKLFYRVFYKKVLLINKKLTRGIN